MKMQTLNISVNIPENVTLDLALIKRKVTEYALNLIISAMDAKIAEMDAKIAENNEALLSAAKALKDVGMSPEQIASTTKLTIEEIIAL